MIKKFLNSFTAQKDHERRAKLYNDFIRHEAKIGGQLFGEVPKGHRREFFCLDQHTWVWHEEWTDETGNYRIMTTRYDVRPTGILKSQNGGHYTHVTIKEAEHLLKAAKLYNQRIKNEVYAFV
jgi:hypothetical protein